MSNLVANLNSFLVYNAVSTGFLKNIFISLIDSLAHFHFEICNQNCNSFSGRY